MDRNYEMDITSTNHSIHVFFFLSPSHPVIPIPFVPILVLGDANIMSIAFLNKFR